MFAEDLSHSGDMAGREALAKAYEDAKDRLGLTQTDIAAAGGPSTTSQSKIGKGRYVSPGSLSKLDKALGWERGTSARIIAGTPASTQVGPLTGYSDRELLDEIADRIARLRERGKPDDPAPKKSSEPEHSPAGSVIHLKPEVPQPGSSRPSRTGQRSPRDREQ